MAQTSNKSGVSEQILSLPKGGGAIKGMGEKFQPDLHTGTGNFSIPISLPPGRNDFGPQLALGYSTGAGNGPFGLGWSLSIPHVSRKTSKGIPIYNDGLDTFILSGAEDLVPVSQVTKGSRQETRYQPRTEGLFARILHVVDARAGEDFWQVTTRDGITSVYGVTADSQIFVTKDGRKQIFAWYLVRSEDKLGNKVRYTYRRDDDPVPVEPNHTYNQIYLGQIEYCNYLEPVTKAESYLFQVDFDYGEFDEDENKTQPWSMRPDPFSAYRAGFEIRTARLCQRILVRSLHPNVNAPTHLIRSYNFNYGQDELSGVSLLQDVVQRGYSTEAPGPEARNWDFATQTAQAAQKHRNTDLYVISFPPVSFAYTGFAPERRKIQDLSFGCDRPPSNSLANPNYELVDMYGNGLPDILQTSPTGNWCWRNLGEGRFTAPRRLQAAPAGVTLADEGVQFADMQGNGSADLLVTEGSARGFYENDFSGEWGRYHPYRQSPSFSLRDPNVRLVDLDGDGVVDVLATLNHHFLYIQNRSKNGELAFATPIPLPRQHDLDTWPDVYFAHPENRVQLADMSGDGLQDIVLIYTGRVDYWPNLGHGRWGRRITLLNGPHLPRRYDPKRLFLADINGDGLADLVYVDTKGIHYWINQSGNRWSDERVITGSPPVTDADSLRIADLLGTGTGGILWSYPWSPTRRANYRYFDFTGGEKPLLLHQIDNHMGALTQVAYQPSTQDYVDDWATGHPWKTPLPFPVNVVSQVVVKDLITGNQLTTRYHYHHGYYDGREHEFRGFGCVDQLDAETFSGKKHEVPPILTKTWFHTGAYYEETEHLDLFRRDYYDGDPDAFTPHSKVETGDAPTEAYRVLSGAVLRTEVYGLDGSAEESHPYTVTENGYQVKLLQPKSDPKGDRPNAIFLTTPLESFSYHYERNPKDPRVAHTLVHEVDAYGNVLKSLEIAYPRRKTPGGTPWPPEQTQHAILLNETEFINQNRPGLPYFIGLVAETKQTEVKVPRLPKLPVRPQDVTSLLQTDPRNLLSHQRHYYDGQSYVGLPLGQLGDRALLTRTETQVLKPQQLQGIYGSKVSRQDLIDAGYIESPAGSDAWWIQTQRTRYADGRQFYQPIGQRDPLGNETTIKYEDPYWLLPIRTTAPLNTTLSVENDYRIVSPYRLTDPNQNQSQVYFNALGMVVATAVMGKAGANPPEGDTLTGFVEAVATDPLLQGDRFLQGATTRQIVYLFNFEREKQPNVIHTLAREIHQSELKPNQTSPVQHSFTYSDGFGRELQTKVQAEPGLAPVRDAQGRLQRNPTGKLKLDKIPARWVGTGRTVYNNKGKPVKQYEPFFSSTHHYESEQDLVEWGVTPILHYDPLERVIRTDNPNGTFSKVEFDAWQQATWDENDTVADSDWYAKRQEPLTPDPEKRAAKQTLQAQRQDLPGNAYGTPTLAYLDVLGRTFLTVEDNGIDAAGTRQLYSTRIQLDIQGNPLSIRDARNNLPQVNGHPQRDARGNIVRDGQDNPVVQTPAFTLLGQNLYSLSMDAGESWTLLNAVGNPVKAWTWVGETAHPQLQTVRTEYDALQRPTHLRVKQGTQPEFLAEYTIYGESRPNPEQLNLRGQIYQQYDGAGVATFEEYDFKGNLLRSSRQLVEKYKETPDWSKNPQLEQEIFTSSTIYDALNRPIQLVAPHVSKQNVQDVKVDVIQPSYNAANLLEQMNVWLKHKGEPTELLPTPTANLQAVKNIDYNEKGQRTLIEYGNGVSTGYHYYPDTFRLHKLFTRRKQGPWLQNLHYTYDPVGNITEIHDHAQRRIFFKGQVVDPHTQYKYDALYRLISAKGREHRGQTTHNRPEHLPKLKPHYDFNDITRRNLQHPHDGKAMRTYERDYFYDAVGNILRMKHKADGNQWSRHYDYEEHNNRLRTTSLPTDRAPSERNDQKVNPKLLPTRYIHDIHGNMTQMPHLSLMQWDYADQLQATAKQVVNIGGTPEITYYTYDASGQRVRKVTEGQITPGGKITRIKERIYLGGFEIYRTYNANENVKLERETLHVMDDRQRIALVETKTKGQDPSPQKLIRYQLGNHLGSVSLELDKIGEVISYEEFYPYGSTSYHSANNQLDTSKRYRYTNKERDEENGLYYCEARYYASWIKRWISCDPIGIETDINLYKYVSNSPINRVDIEGTNDDDITNPKFDLSKNNDIVGNPQKVGKGSEGIQRAFSILREHASKSDVGGGQSELGAYQHKKTGKVFIVAGFETEIPKIKNRSEYRTLGHTHTPYREGGMPASHYLSGSDISNMKSDQVKSIKIFTREGVATWHLTANERLEVLIDYYDEKSPKYQSFKSIKEYKAFMKKTHGGLDDKSSGFKRPARSKTPYIPPQPSMEEGRRMKYSMRSSIKGRLAKGAVGVLMILELPPIQYTIQRYVKPAVKQWLGIEDKKTIRPISRELQEFNAAARSLGLNPKYMSKFTKGQMDYVLKEVKLSRKRGYFNPPCPVPRM